MTLSSICAENVTDVDNANLENTSISTFTDLSNQIDAQENNSTYNLTQNYKFNKTSDTDLINGIPISKNLTIIGYNGSYIDGGNVAREIYVAPYCNVIFKNIIFKNGYSEIGGAAIGVSANANLTIINCTFLNNKVYNANGGAIVASADTNIKIVDSLFENNTSIRVSDAEWKAYKQGMGSAICAAMGVNLNISNSTFRKNNAYLTTILVVSFNEETRIYKPSKLSVDNSSFEDNYAVSSVSIYLDELGQGEIKNTVFRNNKGDKGGNIILDACTSAIVENCLFEGNVGDSGAAIHIKVFEYDYRSNVTIKDCNFTKNKAISQGGAVYAKYGLTKIVNCNFNENDAPHGGAVYTKFAKIEITNSNFDKNTAEYGGALFLRTDENYINSNVFTQNTATGNGGAIHCKMDGVSSSNCIYINNKAPKGNDVYGVFFAKITRISTYFSDVELTIKLTSPWNMPLSQSIKLTFKGTKTYKTGWLKTDSNGVLTLKVPLNINAGSYSLTISFKNGLCNSVPTIKVSQAPVVLTVKKLTTTYKSGAKWQFYVKNSKTNKMVSNAKLNLKVYTGKTYQVYKVTSNSKGLVSFAASKLPAGKHKVIITRQNTNIKLTKLQSQIKVKKATAKISAPKKIKRPSKIKVTVKNKASGKVIKKTKFKLRIYTGKHYKTVNVKTNAKGVFKVSTKKLTKRSHKFLLVLKNKNYKIKNKFSVKVR